MALNAPKLLKLLHEAQAKIAELEARGPMVVERVVEVIGPERIVERVIASPPVVTEVERVVYQDNPAHIETIAALQERLCQFTSV